MRRLPVYIVIDVSESMAGDNLRFLQDGLQRLIAVLRTDPYALETVYISIIVFAGKARTVTPLVELLSFYPPRLPLGSGTSIGSALDHLMAEIKSNVKPSTAGYKGDFKPLVFMMTDGKSTDDARVAITRWRAGFSNLANLVFIGIGPYANLADFTSVTDHVLRLENISDEDFKTLVNWISASISSQSRSIGLGKEAVVNLAKSDDTVSLIDSAEGAAGIDEDFVILTGLCQRDRLPYLMKYERVSKVDEQGTFSLSDQYTLAGVFPAEKDFIELSDERPSGHTIDADLLYGAPGCPHCGAGSAFAVCSCGQIFCTQGTGEAVCPGCNQTVVMSIGEGEDGFEVSRSRG